MTGLKLMMNEPTTENDTATLAFSAVQNALREASASAAAAAAPRPSGASGRRSHAAGGDAATFAAIPADEQRTRHGTEAPARGANDDLPGAPARVTGATLPRRTIRNVSAGLAFSWLVLVGAAAASLFGEGSPTIGLTDALLLAALAIFPLFGIFASAGLLQQQRSVRDTLTAVAQVTVRIAEQQREARQNRKSPEDVAGLRALIDDLNAQRQP
jgi:hypothetical protein